MEIEIKTEEEKPEMDEYELSCKVRTLIEAEEIKQDAELMAKLKPMLEKKAKAVKSLADLRALAKKA